MQIAHHQPHFPRLHPLPTIALLLLTNTALFFAARLVMLSFLWRDITQTGDIARALYIGLKFDARYAVFLTLPVALCLLFPPLELRISKPRAMGRSPWRMVLCWLESLLFGLAVLVYIFDFGIFFYLRQRLDLTILNFMEDPAISAAMVWQSYPVIALLLAFALLVTLYGVLLGLFLQRHTPVAVRNPGQGRQGVSRKSRAAVTVLGLAALFLIGYGQISSNLFPLRWSNAYFSADNNITLLALNPIQNLYDTRRYGKALPPDMNAALEAYPRMAAWLGLPPENRPLSYTRTIAAKPEMAQLNARIGPPNVVIILMESLAWPRTSFAPGLEDDLSDATPFLRELAKDSLYFSNFYAPTRTTARAIFTTISGVPDVNHSGGTTSRNPVLVDQSTLFNEFKGYEKYYMIGGSASWANIRGLLLHNIQGLRLMEESSWQAPNVDVWGLSDLALMREAVDVLGNSPKPFIAFIQTAGFHRPYTIPGDNEGYVPAPAPSPDTLRHYGFESVEEYQSMHFSDYALRRFFDKARQEPWFDNTIFAIFGDHGLTNASANMSPGYLACGLQAWHVPLLLYAPGRVVPGVNDAPHTQLDVFPSLAGLAGLEYRTNTLGRDLLDPRHGQDAMAFISADDNTRFLVEGGFCFSMGTQDALYKLDSPSLVNLMMQEPERAATMKQQAMDFYHTSKYLLFNNGKGLLEKPAPRGNG